MGHTYKQVSSHGKSSVYCTLDSYRLFILENRFRLAKGRERKRNLRCAGYPIYDNLILTDGLFQRTSNKVGSQANPSDIQRSRKSPKYVGSKVSKPRWARSNRLPAWYVII